MKVLKCLVSVAKKFDIFIVYTVITRSGVEDTRLEAKAKDTKKIQGQREQRWSRGHKARGQGHKKNPRPRPRTAFPRTDTLEAKDRNARGQGQGPRTQEQVLSKKNKKKGLHKYFSGDLQKKRKKRVFSKIFQAISTKNRFPQIFQALLKILTFQKLVLSSSRGQANFRGLEASRPRPRT